MAGTVWVTGRHLAPGHSREIVFIPSPRHPRHALPCRTSRENILYVDRIRLRLDFPSSYTFMDPT